MELWTYAVVALIALALFGALVTSISRKWKAAQKSKALAKAKALADFGQQNFCALDHDGDGLITELDLKRTELKENVLLLDLREQLNAIGHVTCAYRSCIVVHCGGLLYPVEVTKERYGIDRNDLQSHPTRVAVKYANW